MKFNPVHSVRWRYRWVKKCILQSGQRQVGKALYGSFFSKGDLVFDIGGNVGSRAILFSKMGARVITLEPVFETYHTLVQNTFKYPTIIPLNKGASDRRGLALIHKAPGRSEIATLNHDWMEKWDDLPLPYKHEEVEPVIVTTLDTLIEQYGVPEFIKIDVEGHELQVLRGLSYPIKALSFEYSPFHLEPAFDCIKQLESLARYEYNYSVGECFKLALPEYVKPEEFYEHLHSLNTGGMNAGDVYARRVNDDLDS